MNNNPDTSNNLDRVTMEEEEEEAATHGDTATPPPSPSIAEALPSVNPVSVDEDTIEEGVVVCVSSASLLSIVYSVYVQRHSANNGTPHPLTVSPLLSRASHTCSQFPVPIPPSPRSKMTVWNQKKKKNLMAVTRLPSKTKVNLHIHRCCHVVCGVLLLTTETLDE
jgi:hypothetical protein